jgi:hypothetical protein
VFGVKKIGEEMCGFNSNHSYVGRIRIPTVVSRKMLLKWRKSLKIVTLTLTPLFLATGSSLGILILRSI